MVVVTEGVAAGERVVVEGMQRIRDGMVVRPAIAPAGGAADSAAPSAAPGAAPAPSKP